MAQERMAVSEAIRAHTNLLLFRRGMDTQAEGKTGSDGHGSVGIFVTGARGTLTVQDVSRL